MPTAGCCWWGRGALHITGPAQYAQLQVIGKDIIETFGKKIDLCQNPNAICKNKNLVWLSGFSVWSHKVQRDTSFMRSLSRFVYYQFNLDKSAFNRNTLIAGIGGLLSNKKWDSRAPNVEKTTENFLRIMHAFKAKGLVPGFETKSSLPPVLVVSWFRMVRGQFTVIGALHLTSIARE